MKKAKGLLVSLLVCTVLLGNMGLLGTIYNDESSSFIIDIYSLNGDEPGPLGG